MSSGNHNLGAHIDIASISALVPTLSGANGRAQVSNIAAFVALLPALLAAGAIDTPLRIAHFLAQLAHESDGFATTVEYASGAAYETRTDLGNTAARDGDGPRYKGRGLIQLTGGRNYRLFTVWMCKREPSAPDFAAHPELVAEFPWAGWSAVFFWSTHGLNAYADRDDLVGATKIINGGRNGLAERAQLLARAKVLIATLQADRLSGEQNYPVLRRGMTGPDIEWLQRALSGAGFYHLAIDAAFGAGTEQAVRAFQRARGLVVDGLVGLATGSLLETMLERKGA